MDRKRQNAENNSCGCGEQKNSRRVFLGKASCALFAALAASGVSKDAWSLPVAAMSAEGTQGDEQAYPLPSGDSVNIDQKNDVILVRSGSHVYAFALACPHENTALRWRPQDQRFQCPRHQSKYSPDGTFMSGRATRNMDRFALRLEGGKVIVDLSKLYQSVHQKTEWDSAVLTI